MGSRCRLRVWLMESDVCLFAEDDNEFAEKTGSLFAPMYLLLLIRSERRREKE